MKSNKKTPIVLFWSFIAIQLTVDVIRFDFWPLSPYPMYAHPRPIDSVYAFQIQADLRDSQRQKIPVPGGAATMYIYNQKIQAKSFADLEKRMRSDVLSHLKINSSLRKDEITSLRLIRVGLNQDPVSQLISVTETTLHHFDF